MSACNRLFCLSCVATTIVYPKQRKFLCKTVSCKERAPTDVLCYPIYSNPSWTKYTCAYITFMGKMALQIPCLKHSKLKAHVKNESATSTLLWCQCVGPTASIFESKYPSCLSTYVAREMVVGFTIRK